MLKARRLWILSIGPVGFATAMASSVSMVYLRMAKLIIKSGVGDVLLETILDELVSIDRVFQSDSGVFMVSMYFLWRSMLCRDNIRRSLCLS